MKVLITAREVVNYSPVKNDYPLSYVCDHILNVELDLFDCLGMKLYENLKADLIVYNNIAVYDGQAAYAIGDKVLLDGCIFISKVADNFLAPVDPDAWDVAKKFQKECYNELWVNFLRRYLAFNIIYTSINYSTFQAGANGLVKFIGSADSGSVENVSDKTLYAYKDSLYTDASKTLRNMERWMAANTTCFPVDAGSCEESCKKKRRSSRIAFGI